MGVETHIGLTPKQTFYIADYAMRNEYYTLGFDWLKVTENKIKEAEKHNCPHAKDVSLFQIANTYKQNQRQVTNCNCTAHSFDLND